MNQKELLIKTKSTTPLCFATLGNIPALSSISGDNATTRGFYNEVARIFVYTNAGKVVSSPIVNVLNVLYFKIGRR